MKKGITAVGYASAKYTEETNTLSYGAVRYLNSKVAGGREYSANPRGDSQKIYADSRAIYGDTVNDGYDILLTLLSSFDEQFREEWLNEKRDDDGIAEYATAEELPYHALIIHEDTPDGVGLISVYYYCQASGRPSDSGKTAEGGNFNFEFPQYPIIASPRPTDMLVRYQIHGKEKLTEIPTPTGKISAKIEFSLHKIMLTEDGTATISATALPEGTTITWTTADSSVATVSGGVVTAVGAGNTIITGSITVDGVTYTDTCTVIVTAAT
ncbi:MAG: hypothetical protein IJ723_07185 [Ruminococcus sp.]|nr:hypothetical protein [Ruminococcus sp.]